MTQHNTPAVVTKVYDLLLWVIPKLAKFSKDQRYLLAQRIENTLLDILEILIEASFTKDKLNLLREAILKLEKIAFFSADKQRYALYKSQWIRAPSWAGQRNRKDDRRLDKAGEYKIRGLPLRYEPELLCLWIQEARSFRGSRLIPGLGWPNRRMVSSVIRQ